MVEWNIIHIDETDSTNQWITSHGDLSPCEGKPTVVWADYQTAGRGCGTNRWESERGKNLLFSMLVYPHQLPANRQFRISEVVSVALCETLEPYMNNQVEIKWPNDIYVDGRKICGILVENRLYGGLVKACVIGIGLNVNQEVFLSDAPNPVSLYQLTGRTFDRETVLHDFLRRFESVSSMETLCSQYRNRLFLRQKQSVFKDQNGLFRATIEDVEADGHLVMRDEAGRERRYAFKEVSFMIKN